jgi:hypothetical protein
MKYWEVCVPQFGTIRNAVARAPRMAPKVFAAESSPTTRAGSDCGPKAERTAKGKLAPQSIADGTIVTTQRIKSRNAPGQLAIQGNIHGERHARLASEKPVEAHAIVRISSI